MLQKKKLAIVTTHPIQYYAPLFQMLQKEIDIRVFYTWGEDSVQKFDPGFGKIIEWDIPLLNGYPYEFMVNTAKKPGSDHFWGIVNPTLIPAIKAYMPHAILVLGWAYQSHFQVMRFFKGRIPVWFRGDSTILDHTQGFYGFLKNSIRKVVLKYVYSYTDILFYVGKTNFNYLQWIGISASKLHFTPHAIDNHRFASVNPEKVAALRKSLEIPDDAIIILYAGKLEQKKNPLLVIEAFKKVAISRQYLIIVGNGNLKEKVNTAIQQSNKMNQIKFLGFQNQLMMPVIYQLADLFVLPSSGPQETWGLAVNEAMAASCSIWVTEKVGCAADLVQEGVNGKILPAGNSALWENAILDATDKESLQQQGLQSKRIIENFTYQHIVSKMVGQLNQNSR